MGFEKTVLTWDSGMRENVTAGNVVGRGGTAIDGFRKSFYNNYWSNGIANL